MRTTHSRQNLAVQMALPLSRHRSTATATASATSATHAQDNAYLCAWLRSRLEDGTWTIRGESALTATSSDRAQVTRLAHKARALGLAVWPQRAGKVVAA